MENFDYDLLMTGLVKGRFGLDPKNVARFEIKKGMFRVIDKEGKAHEVKIEETDEFVFTGCGPCFDFASELADISVGSVGSSDGWSLPTRTDTRSSPAWVAGACRKPYPRRVWLAKSCSESQALRQIKR
jgi:coenzyme F420 hydrogenase subunit beta